MNSKYGIFLVNGNSHVYQTIGSTGISRLNVGDFNDLDEVEAYLTASPVRGPRYFVLEYFNLCLLSFYFVSFS